MLNVGNEPSWSSGPSARAAGPSTAQSNSCDQSRGIGR
uniref:Uncharacterized protein n=1 Tax=Arundo donax TaxID=35708 RepID=A0A0A9GQB1_ARUDO